MGHRLRALKVEDGLIMQEKACENYVCSSCNKKMISANFVNGICIQVFVSHGETCEHFIGNAFRRTVEVTCETCAHYENGVCTWVGEENKSISSVRTGGAAV